MYCRFNGNAKTVMSLMTSESQIASKSQDDVIDVTLLKTIFATLQFETTNLYLWFPH